MKIQMLTAVHMCSEAEWYIMLTELQIFDDIYYWQPIEIIAHISFHSVIRLGDYIEHEKKHFNIPSNRLIVRRHTQNIYSSFVANSVDIMAVLGLDSTAPDYVLKDKILDTLME